MGGRTGERGGKSKWRRGKKGRRRMGVRIKRKKGRRINGGEEEGGRKIRRKR